MHASIHVRVFLSKPHASMRANCSSPQFARRDFREDAWSDPKAWRWPHPRANNTPLCLFAHHLVPALAMAAGDGPSGHPWYEKKDATATTPARPPR